MSKRVVIPVFSVGVVCFLGGLIAGGVVFAQAKFPTAKTVLTQDLPDIDGYEAQIIEVSLAPGSELGGHRHSGHMFVYVVEGQIVSQLEDGQKVTYSPGEFWYEHPMILHADFLNPSDSVPAKAVIFSIVEEGKPQTILEPADTH